MNTQIKRVLPIGLMAVFCTAALGAETLWIRDTGAMAVPLVSDPFAESLILRGQTPEGASPGNAFSAASTVSQSTGTGWLGNTFLSSTKALVQVASPQLFASGAFLNKAFDSGTLFQAVPGILANPRAPGQNELQSQGRRFGQSIGNGSHWFPARRDLDTMLSKIDSRLVDNVVAINGPYTSLYGPGFSFYSVDLLDTPRYGSGFESHGSTTLEYESNGEQWHGRQAFEGGSTNWGYRVGYSHRTGNDYEAGNGDEFPASYNSRMLDVSVGANLTGDDNLEIHAFRLDQTDLEFPGQWMDINYLVTDAYEFEYTRSGTTGYDTMSVEGWYNRTRFEGDNTRAGKQRVVPFASSVESRTDVDAMSSGYRAALTWQDTIVGDMTAGTDLRYLRQNLNEFNDLFGGAISVRAAIPDAHWSNPGVFWETRRTLHEWIDVSTGARVDWVSANADGFGLVGDEIALETAKSDLGGGSLDQHFSLSSVYVNADVQLTNNCFLNVAGGRAMRAPTMTELYASGSPFIASLPQTRSTALRGDPNLRPEELWQVDAGLNTETQYVSAGLHGFYAWINDYITLDLTDNGTLYAFVNTDRASMTGFDAFANVELTAWLKGFATMNYVEGEDHTRSGNVSSVRGSGRLPPAQSTVRRSNSSIESEPLPVIPPLEARVGLVLHEPRLDRWSVEFSVRMMDEQDRVAASLLELPTESFAVFDIRAYAQLVDNFVITAGVLNATDEHYLTYFDSRGDFSAQPGLQVFRPGVSFYFGSELTY